jgi:hypothetical protein
MKIRKGAPKAILALAHHMILVVHQVLSRKEEYVEFGADYYDRRNRPRAAARLVKRLQSLGYRVELQEVEPEAETEPLTVEAPANANPEVPTKRKRGRPCKCAERGIICRHRTSEHPNSLREQPSSTDQFS